MLSHGLCLLALNLLPGGSEPAVEPVAGQSGTRTEPAAEEEAPPSRRQRKALAHRAIDAGEFLEARRILGELQFEDDVLAGRELLEQDNPQDALIHLERAVDLDHRSREARLLLAEGFLRLGALQQDRLYYEDALRHFAQAGDSPRALFGASRAAWNLFDSEGAVSWARRGMAAIDAGASAEGIDPIPERILFDATYLAYTQAVQAGGPAERAAALFDQAEHALGDLMGQNVADPWVHGRLADLYLWAGRSFDALSAIERGLGYAPEDPNLVGRLASRAHANAAAEGGSASGAVIATFDRYLDRYPGSALGWWYRGKSRFDAALELLLDPAPDGSSGELAARGFEGAEVELRRCRELDPELEAQCRGWEVMCRNGVGWVRYNAGDLAGARAAFTSTEEALEGGLEWQLEGSLLSGVMGLRFAADGHSAEGNLAGAAAIYDQLHAYRPGDADFANNAGFFNRDAGDALEADARALRRLAAGGVIEDEVRLGELARAAGIERVKPGGEAGRERLALAADELEARARAHFERSWSAYLVASELAPDDVRVVNDTALIAVYYLHRELDRAEQMLLRCVELGAIQLEDTSLSEEERFALTEAWGDAHQNLGVLFWDEKNGRRDPARAIPWLERSVEIGPVPRPEVTERYLPECRAALGEEGGG